MANLRSKGYPSSASNSIPTTRKARTPRVLSGTAVGIEKKEIPKGSTADMQTTPRAEMNQLVDDKAERYANVLNSMLNKTNLPVNVSGGTYLYEPDYNWGKWTNTDLTAKSPNGERLGFAHKTHYFNPAEKDNYTAGIDNLEAIFPNDIAEKAVNLPLGITAYGGVESGSLYGGLQVPQKNYYLMALANLLRGQQ